MKLSNYDFWARSGSTNYCKDYDPSLVQPMTKNRIRLHASTDKSAGILGPKLGMGHYEIEMTGRLDGLDPSQVMTAYLWDPSNNEVDLAEFSRWNDANQYKFLNMAFVKGLTPATDTDPGTYQYLNQHHISQDKPQLGVRGFDRFKLTLDWSPKVATVRAYGWWNLHQDWKEFGALEQYNIEGMDFGYFRVALWTMKIGPTYSASASRPTKYVTLESLKFTPL